MKHTIDNFDAIREHLKFGFGKGVKRMKKLIAILAASLAIGNAIAFNPIRVGGGSYATGGFPDLSEESSEYPGYPGFSVEYGRANKYNCIKHGIVRPCECTFCGADGKPAKLSGCRECIKEKHDRNIQALKKKKETLKKRKEEKSKSGQNKNEKSQKDALLRTYSGVDGKLIKIRRFVKSVDGGGLYIGYWGYFEGLGVNRDFYGYTYDDVAIILQNINIADGSVYCVWFFGEKEELPLTVIGSKRVVTTKPKYAVSIFELTTRNNGTNNPKYAGFHFVTTYDFVVSSTNDFQIIEAIPQ